MQCRHWVSSLASNFVGKRRQQSGLQHSFEACFFTTDLSMTRRLLARDNSPSTCINRMDSSFLAWWIVRKLEMLESATSCNTWFLDFCWPRANVSSEEIRPDPSIGEYLLTSSSFFALSQCLRVIRLYNVNTQENWKLTFEIWQENKFRLIQALHTVAVSKVYSWVPLLNCWNISQGLERT